MKLNYKILVNTAEIIEFAWQAPVIDTISSRLTIKDFIVLDKIFAGAANAYSTMPNWTDGNYTQEEYEKLYDKFWKLFKHYKKDICRFSPLIKQLTEKINNCDCWGNARNIARACGINYLIEEASF